MHCTACTKKRPQTNVSIYIHQIQTLYQNRMIWWWFKTPWDDLIKAATTEKFHSKIFWACDLCFKNNIAFRAHPEQQTYCDHMPYLAYYDHKKKCKTCELDFVFSAQEQLRWYEEFNFWVQAKPKHCLGCRKKRRNEKSLNRELSLLLKEGDPKTQESCERAAALYLSMELPLKAKHYTTLANKCSS